MYDRFCSFIFSLFISKVERQKSDSSGACYPHFLDTAMKQGRKKIGC
ncbi:hypothetical protein PMCN01_1782 [Pasteurella multocida subsp. multocida HB01]|nr:hypothetical protein Pmu_18380 [Pasteurella multocida 36950]AHE65209.1 hypothetical protein PMCN03_1778 [Pasteurella multocida subsp. multocida str. HB03]ANJ90999.1 hypothetical protein PMCN01_1782 [Pasteurella multocida subsp. multocida HB01]